jgi:hypothetical protein
VTHATICSSGKLLYIEQPPRGIQCFRTSMMHNKHDFEIHQSTKDV